MTKVKKQNKMGKIDSCDKETKSFFLQDKRKEEKIKEDVTSFLTKFRSFGW